MPSLCSPSFLCSSFLCSAFLCCSAAFLWSPPPMWSVSSILWMMPDMVDASCCFSSQPKSMEMELECDKDFPVA
uniref:Secreted protein n=1 Tax=Arundo donax TaxID=35708 RepID=A0A0A9F655_ARUDO